jgi:hypothetical protein
MAMVSINSDINMSTKPQRNTHEKQDFIPVSYRLQGQPPDEQSPDALVATVTHPAVPNKQTQEHPLLYSTPFPSTLCH